MGPRQSGKEGYEKDRKDTQRGRKKEEEGVGEMTCHSGLTQNLLATSWTVLLDS